VRLTAIPIFLTLDSRAASSGSRFSMIVSCASSSGSCASSSLCMVNNPSKGQVCGHSLTLQRQRQQLLVAAAIVDPMAIVGLEGGGQPWKHNAGRPIGSSAVYGSMVARSHQMPEPELEQALKSASQEFTRACSLQWRNLRLRGAQKKKSRRIIQSLTNRGPR
jgi:hypothetical protein